MSEPTPPQTSFEAGQEAGRVAQILREHSQHFDRLNGSMDKSANALIALTSEVRSLREESERQQNPLEHAAEVLAKETRYRRDKQAETQQGSEFKFTRRERFAGFVTAVALTVVGYLLGK